MGLTVSSILLDLAAAAEKQAGAQHNTAATAAFLGTAELLRVVASLVNGKTDAEALAHLEHIRDHGTTPITQAEKDAQVRTAAEGGPAALAGLKP